MGQTGAAPTLEQWQRRRRRRRIVLIAAGAVLLAVSLILQDAPAGSERRTGRVTRIDGPTRLVLATDAGATIGLDLYGVAAEPEGPGVATAWLTEALLNRRVMAICPAGIGAALVYRDDGLFVNEYLVDQGLACADRSVARPWREWFGRVEGWAASAERGQWGGRWAVEAGNSATGRNPR